MSSKIQLFKNVMQDEVSSKNKVTIVGSGSVAMATAFSILEKGISNNVVIIGRNDEKVRGEILDLQHGAFFMKNASIIGGADFSLSTGSKVIIYAAGAKPKEGESRLDLVQKNVDILRTLIPRLIRYSPDAILLIVSSPSDILAFVAWKLTGLPKHRVLGAGTHLDTTSFRLKTAQRLGAASTSVHGWIIGEHGESSIPVWSTLNIAGTRLHELNTLAGEEGDTENWSDVHKEIVNVSSEVTRLKGFMSWGIGLSCADLTSSLLRTNSEVKTVSTMVKGLYGINKEVFMSLPCTLNASGVTSVVYIKLNQAEQLQLRASANILDEIHKGVIF